MGAGSAAAQEVSTWLDATASHARPPGSQSAYEPTTYGLITGRLEAALTRATLGATAQLGSAVMGAQGRWLYGDLAAAGGRRIGRMGARIQLSGFGLHYLEPFEYTAAGGELRPTFSVPLGSVTVSARPLLMAGTWRTDFATGSLAIAGGELAVQKSVGGVSTSVSGGALHVENGVLAGPFARGGVEAVYAGTAWTASARLDAQQTPLETEVGGGIGVVGEIRPGLHLHLNAGRNVRDPRLGTAGSLALSVGVAVRPTHVERAAAPAVVAVGEPRGQGRQVTFTIRAPDASEVAVAGDFSGWDPVPMEQTQNGWRLETVLSPGLHHFGFLVDGQWALPAGAPGVVDDGWGRKNASVVVGP